jgi:microcystin-dependent protein
MTYIVEFTEKTNPSKPAITVQDQTLETQSTSLTFVGQNHSNYAPVLAEDFLHLLENFANATSPIHPIQGQLWYDNASNLLKVFDGTTWVEAGSVKKAGKTTDGVPAISSSVLGDLWVDTDSSQLYLFSGSAWILIGPQFSQGAQTGPVVENIVDVNGFSHSVVSVYSSGTSTTTSYRICIISKDTFIPKISIAGFSNINEGINLSTVDSNGLVTTTPTRFYGTASSADSLLIKNVAVPSGNFLRSDVASATNFPITIQNSAGLTIGADASFSIGKNSNSTIFNSSNSGSNVSFNLNNAGVNSTVVFIDPTGKVGIGQNNTSPASTLDVNGIITASTTSGGINVLGTTNSTGLNTGSIKTAGGFSVALNSNFGGNVTTYGNILLNNLISNVPSAGAVMLPGRTVGDTTASLLYDIGSPTQRFRNVYAQNFVGAFNGSFTGALSGSVNGSAAKLASPTNFSIVGDIVSTDIISFNGQTTSGAVEFNTVLNTDIIGNKTFATDSYLQDELLVNRPGTTNALLKMTKETFLSHVATVPVGVIMPFAGATPPAGYLLCDGSEISASIYSVLFNVIGYVYKQTGLVGTGTFALPDLRGRFALGSDNMDNNLTVQSISNPNIQVSAGGGSANRVTDPTGDTLGTGAGSQSVTLGISNLPDHLHSLNTGSTQYYAVGIPDPGQEDTAAVNGFGLTSTNAAGQGYGLTNSSGVISSTTGQAISTMNPYQTVNYIIFTGVL